MPEIETSIWLALRARVASLSLEPDHPVAWPNQSFTPPQSEELPAPYLRVSHLPNTTDRFFVDGSAPHRFQGILQVDVMSRLDEDTSVAAQHAGLVAAHFPADLRLAHGDVRLRITKRPDVARGRRDEASSRWMTPVSILYETFS